MAPQRTRGRFCYSLLADGDGPANVESREVGAKIKNVGDVPLGGVWVAFEISVDDRPQPVETGSICGLANIPGALMPGETIEGVDYAFMDEHAKGIVRSADDVRVTMYVENIADGEMRGVKDHPQMGSWATALSNALCRSS